MASTKRGFLAAILGIIVSTKPGNCPAQAQPPCPQQTPAKSVGERDDRALLSSGKWRLERLTVRTRLSFADQTPKGSQELVFSRLHYDVNGEGVRVRYRYELIPNRNPKQFKVWHVPSGHSSSEKITRECPVVHGVYEIKDGVLRRSWSEVDEPLPTTVDPPTGRYVVTTTHRLYARCSHSHE